MRTLEYRPPGHPHRDEMDQRADKMEQTPAWTDENCCQSVMAALRRLYTPADFNAVTAATGVSESQLRSALAEGTQVLSPTEFVVLWRHVS